MHSNNTHRPADMELWWMKNHDNLTEFLAWFVGNYTHHQYDFLAASFAKNLSSFGSSTLPTAESWQAEETRLQTAPHVLHVSYLVLNDVGLVSLVIVFIWFDVSIWEGNANRILLLIRLSYLYIIVGLIKCLCITSFDISWCYVYWHLLPNCYKLVL